MIQAELPWRGGPGPMPLPPRGTIAGPTMPAQLFPTNNLRWGDVVNVTGPFAGLFQGAVRVKFVGAPWQAPFLTGPYSGSVQVPEGAQTGECAIEVNGQRVFGAQCSLVSGPGDRAAFRGGPYGRAWKNVGDKAGGIAGIDLGSPLVTAAIVGLVAAELDYRYLRHKKGARITERFAVVALGAALLKGML